MRSLSFDKRLANASLGDLLSLGFSHRGFGVERDVHGNRQRQSGEPCGVTHGNI